LAKIVVFWEPYGNLCPTFLSCFPQISLINADKICVNQRNLREILWPLVEIVDVIEKQ